MKSLRGQVVVVVQVIYCAGKAESIGNPFRAIPAPGALDEERRELGEDHTCPIIAVTLGVVEEPFDGVNLCRSCGNTYDVIVFSISLLFEPYLPHASCPEGLDAYGFAVRHNQFCVRIDGLGSRPDKAVVPVSCTPIERYAKLKWFGRLYPMVL